MAKVRREVGAGRLGRLRALVHCVRVDDVHARSEEVFDVLCGLLDLELDVHGESRRLWDGEAEVEGDRTGDAPEADEQAPHVVDVCDIPCQGVLVCDDDDQRHN